MSNSKSRGLGRGLNALFEDDEDSGLSSVLADDADEPVTGILASRLTQKLGVEQLSPSAVQPRMDFDQEALQNLADSIQVHGILQPILVRQKVDLIDKTPIDGHYEIIAGERRWRAAQLAQLHEIPVIIREFDDAQAMQIALIENLQRADLNPVEEALGYQRLMDEHEYTQLQLSELLGRSRSHIANMTRMLGLSDSILTLVRTGDLTPGHARALITMRDPMPLAEKIIAENMSVRAVERYINNINKKQQDYKDKRDVEANSMPVTPGKTIEILSAEEDISNYLGMRFSIETKDIIKGGYIRVDFKNMDQLNDLIDLLRGQKTGLHTPVRTILD